MVIHLMLTVHAQGNAQRRPLARHWWVVAVDLTLTSHADVAAALAAEHLVPPARPSSIPPGPVADLRDAMARFSGPDLHEVRRADVDAALRLLDNYPLDILGRDRTRSLVSGEPIDALDRIGRVVPTVTLAAALGVHDHELSGVLADVRAIAVVIGRGEPSTPAADGAAVRLLERFESHEFGPVAGVSLLYQNHDATAALFAATVVAAAHGAERRGALARTVRVAVADTVVADLAVPAGTAVVLDLEQSGWEFGAGPHACPGRGVAERLVAAMVGALDDAGYVVDIGGIEYADDGRATALPMSVGRAG